MYHLIIRILTTASLDAAELIRFYEGPIRHGLHDSPAARDDLKHSRGLRRTISNGGLRTSSRSHSFSVLHSEPSDPQETRDSTTFLLISIACFLKGPARAVS